jgi:hypothetical protein
MQDCGRKKKTKNGIILLLISDQELSVNGIFIESNIVKSSGAVFVYKRADEAEWSFAGLEPCVVE